MLITILRQPLSGIFFHFCAKAFDLLIVENFNKYIKKYKKLYILNELHTPALRFRWLSGVMLSVVLDYYNTLVKEFILPDTHSSVKKTFLYKTRRVVSGISSSLQVSFFFIKETDQKGQRVDLAMAGTR